TVVCLCYLPRCRGPLHRPFDWQIFFFFLGGLSFLVAGFAKTGLLVQLGGWLVRESSGNLALAVTLVLWTTALISQIVDNVPLVTVFIPVIGAMSSFSGVSIAPLAWSLAVGIGIGVLATPLASPSNIV